MAAMQFLACLHQSWDAQSKIDEFQNCGVQEMVEAEKAMAGGRAGSAKNRAHQKPKDAKGMLPATLMRKGKENSQAVPKRVDLTVWNQHSQEHQTYDTCMTQR
jgi:hypothetical protein